MAMEAAFSPADERELAGHLVLYRCALRSVETLLVNMNDCYTQLAEINPIEHIKCRLKSVDSIAAKLATRGLPVTARSAVENLTDIAGARVICCYAKDIDEIVAAITAHEELEVITAKDYVTQAKPSGYRSFHMVVQVSPGGHFGTTPCPVEVQIRTAAMDFWASLEHRVRYKYQGDIPDHLSNELRVCADKIHELDERLYLIHELVDLINE